jgi:hypothetical protein
VPSALLTAAILNEFAHEGALTIMDWPAVDRVRCHYPEASTPCHDSPVVARYDNDFSASTAALTPYVSPAESHLISA